MPSQQSISVSKQNKQNSEKQILEGEICTSKTRRKNPCRLSKQATQLPVTTKIRLQHQKNKMALHVLAV